MSAEQTPDIADLAAVLADLNAEGWTTESDHDPGCPGDERYCMSHCPVPVQVRRGPDDLAAALAPVLAAAWDAGYEQRAASLGMAADPNPYRADLVAEPASTEDRADWTQAQVITAKSALDAVTDYANAETARANAAEAEVKRLLEDRADNEGTR